MQAISVINFKGGVGKTTLTANLGVELARRGNKVLLMDLDPQCGLTFSFYSPEEYHDGLRGARTIRCWLDGFVGGIPNTGIKSFLVAPERVNKRIREHGTGDRHGYVHLIPSDLTLLQLELDILRAFGPASTGADVEIFRRRGALWDALRVSPIVDYDFVLIDCPPNVGILTQSALIASDHVLIPTKADYLSTVGIESLVRALDELRVEYNTQRARYGLVDERQLADPRRLGIVFNMIQYQSSRPLAANQFYIDRVKRLGEPILSAMIRDSPRHFGRISPVDGPAILKCKVSELPYIELMELTTEFLGRVEAGRQFDRRDRSGRHGRTAA